MDVNRDPEEIIESERALRDRQAGEYDARFAVDAYVHKTEDASLTRALGVRAGETVLDAGCGTGRHLPWLVAEAERVIGVDHSDQSLATASARLSEEDRSRVRLHRGDLRSLPLHDASVDRVLCCEVIQHIPTPEYRLRAVRELGRVLRPGGVLVLSAYRWLGRVKRHRDGFWGENLYRHAFTPRELRHLVHAAGFADVDVGGITLLPRATEWLGVSPERQARLTFTPLARHLAQYVVARAVKP